MGSVSFLCTEGMTWCLTGTQRRRVEFCFEKLMSLQAGKLSILSFKENILGLQPAWISALLTNGFILAKENTVECQL